MLSLPFLSIDELDRLGIPADDERRRLNRIINPLSETSPYLRTTILPGLLATAARNRSRGNDDLALFESGSVFFANDPLVAAPQVPVSQRPSARPARAIGSGAGSAATSPRRPPCGAVASR